MEKWRGTLEGMELKKLFRVEVCFEIFLKKFFLEIFKPI